MQNVTLQLLQRDITLQLLHMIIALNFVHTVYDLKCLLFSLKCLQIFKAVHEFESGRKLSRCGTERE